MTSYLSTTFKPGELEWYRWIIEELLRWQKEHPKEKLEDYGYSQLIRSLIKRKGKNNSPDFPSKWKLNLVIFRYYPYLLKTSFGKELRYFLTKTKIRSLSGIVPLSVFTKGRGCPFHCVYCPTAGSEDVPKSYFPDEAAVQRAIRFDFDPYKQVEGRLLMFYLSGHNIDKVELIIQGGTFSFYPKSYRRWFVKRCFDAANSRVDRLVQTGVRQEEKAIDLPTAQKKNEKALSRLVGITIETRPDFITKEELRFLRSLGVTRVEIGVQIVDDRILKLVKRGHTVEDIKRATYLLKEFGFKVTYHLMLNLPGSSPKYDLEMLKEIFTNPDYRPDNIKLYPTALVKGAELLEWYKKGKYQPYSRDKLVEVLVKFKEKIVPEYLRIQRLVRDLTKDDQYEVLVESHLRQKLQRARVKCNCIRCREVRDNPEKEIWLKSFAYRASQGIEYFLSYVDKNNRLYGLLRLRILDNSQIEFPWQGIIRELHIYGHEVGLGHRDEVAVQHRGLGRKLLHQAELIAREHKVKRLAVISGVGVREYYRKLGFKLKGTYMVKELEYNEA